MQLRDYQNEAIAAFFDFFRRNATGNPVIKMPTGTGKSLVIAAIASIIHKQVPTHKTIILTHIQELIANNHRTLIRYWPTAPAGINSAGLNRRECDYPITFAGIQSVYKLAELFGPVDMVLIDEAHLVGDSEATMYLLFLNALRVINPHIRIGGLSATAFRQGMGDLTNGGIFTHVCYDLTTLAGFRRLLDAGHIVPLIVPQTSTYIDVSDVPVSSTGEFNQVALEAASNHEDLSRRALEEILDKARGRKKGLIFTASIKHCESVSRILTSMGVSNRYVHSKLKRAVRNEVFEQYAAHAFEILVNKDMVTTGHDYAEIDYIGDLQGTRSVSKHVQKLGRMTRPAPWAGKVNGLALDFCRNCETLGPIDDPQMPTPKRKRGAASVAYVAPQPRVKLCPNPRCACYNHVSVTNCTTCGTEFPIIVKIEQQAGTAVAMRLMEPEGPAKEFTPDVATIIVDTVDYSPHTRQGRRSLRVNYACGLRTFREFVCVEYTGHARRAAERWWNERVQGPLLPMTVDAALALAHLVPIPKRIRVRTDKKHPEVVHHEY